MKHIILGIVATLALFIGSGTLLLSSTAEAACKTEYKTECVATDKDGKCTKYERVSHEVCTPDKEPIHVSPPKQECFECTEHNKDGSCKKTRKVAC